MNKRNIIKIKQKKNSLDKMVSSSFLALFVIIGLYMYQNMSIVFKMVEYKNTLNHIADLEKKILLASDDITEYKKSIAIDSEVKSRLVKVSSKNFVVRKNIGTDFTILYDAKN